MNNKQKKRVLRTFLGFGPLPFLYSLDSIADDSDWHFSDKIWKEEK